MNIRRALLAITVLLSGFLSHAATAEESRDWAPYNELYSLYEKFQSIPPDQRDRLVFHVKVAPVDKNIKLNSVQLSLIRKSGRTEMPIQGDGILEFPVDEQLHRENPPIFTNLPAGKKLELKIDVLIQLPNRSTFRYNEMMQWLKQANDGVRSHAGIWALFMPKADGLELKFSDPKSGYLQIQAKDGEKRLNADAQGVLRIPLDKQYQSENPTVVLSTRPAEVRPHFPSSMSLFVDSDVAAR